MLFVFRVSMLGDGRRAATCLRALQATCLNIYSAQDSENQATEDVHSREAVRCMVSELSLSESWK